MPLRCSVCSTAIYWGGGEKDKTPNSRSNICTPPAVHVLVFCEKQKQRGWVGFFEKKQHNQLNNSNKHPTNYANEKQTAKATTPSKTPSKNHNTHTNKKHKPNGGGGENRGCYATQKQKEHKKHTGRPVPSKPGKCMASNRPGSLGGSRKTGSSCFWVVAACCGRV